MFMRTSLFYKAIVITTIYSISMAFLESAVVVYLRAIAYPEGFSFPVQTLDPTLAVTEIIREAATIFMLFAAAWLAGRFFTERFAWFLYCFAIWDIFYYVFLKLILNWPESFLTWDLLFLIPVMWSGPVLSPLIASLTMIMLASAIFYFSYSKNIKPVLALREWTLLIIGSLIILAAFMLDFIKYVNLNYQPANDLASNLQNLSSLYIPVSFNWPLFIVGEIILILAIAGFVRRNRKLIV